MKNKNTDGIYGWSYSSYEETDNWENHEDGWQDKPDEQDNQEPKLDKNTQKAIEELNHINNTIVEITNDYREEKNAKIVHEDELGFILSFDNEDVTKFLNNCSKFTTGQINFNEKENYFSSQSLTHDFMITLLKNNDFEFTTRQLLEIIYLYNYFPFQIKTQLFTRAVLSESQVIERTKKDYENFYNKLILRTYMKNNLGYTSIEKYFENIARKFNNAPRMKLTEQEYEKVLNELNFHDDVPIEQSMIILFGKNYEDEEMSKLKASISAKQLFDYNDFADKLSEQIDNKHNK